MNNLTQAHEREGRDARGHAATGNTWMISLLYIGTFGSFIGFSFAFGQVLQVQFTGHVLHSGQGRRDLTFLGPLLGSLVRPVGGSLADRFSGSMVTFLNFIAMALGAAIVLAASQLQSLPLYLIGFMLLFVFSGLGNGSVYKMIPAIFKAKAAAGVRRRCADRNADALASPPAFRRPDRHGRGDRRLRRRAGQPGLPAVVHRARSRPTRAYSPSSCSTRSASRSPGSSSSASIRADSLGSDSTRRGS